MRLKRLAIVLAGTALAVTGATASASAGPAVSSEPAASAPAVSAEPAAENGTQAVNGTFYGDGVRIWSQPGRGVVRGLGYRGHAVTAHCNVSIGGSGAYSWVYITNRTTGVSGYSYLTFVVNADRLC